MFAELDTTYRCYGVLQKVGSRHCYMVARVCCYAGTMCLSGFYCVARVLLCDCLCVLRILYCVLCSLLWCSTEGGF